MAKKKTPTPSSAEGAPAAEPPAALDPMPPGEGLLLAHNQLEPSPNNPRKTFDAEALAGLADSIDANGILENLVVRPGSRDGIYEIVAGERRWRAVGLLVERGRWAADDPRIPASCHAFSAAEALAIALLENVQRQDLDPVEEGRAFAQLRDLDPAKWSTAAIAARIGKTQRHVQKRISLVERLAAPVAEALSKGEINLEQAKLFALGDAKTQTQVIKQIRRGDDWLGGTENLREAMVEKLVPVERAIFDRALYKGEIVEDEAEGESYFADTAEFQRLQADALRAKKDELLKAWPWVDVLDNASAYHNYGSAPKGHKKAGAIVWVDWNGELTIREGVLRAKDRESGSRDVSDRAPAAKKKTKPEDVRWLTQAQVQTVKQAKTLALRRALADSPKAGLAVAILALVGSRDIDVQVPGEWQSRSRYLQLEPPKSELLEQERRLAKLIVALPGKGSRRDVAGGKDAGLDEEALAGTFEALMELETDELLGILAAAAAPRVGVWMNASGGDDPFALALAKATGAYERLDGLWHPKPEYFQAYRRDTLQTLALANALGEGFNRLKKSEQVALLAKQPFWTWRHFAELQFLDDKAMQKAMAGPALMVQRPAAPVAAAEPPAEEMRCRACGAAALRKHKKGCALAGEGKVSAASCGPDPGDAPPPAEPAGLPRCRGCGVSVFGRHEEGCTVGERDAPVGMPDCADAADELAEPAAAPELDERDIGAHEEGADPLDLPPALDRRRRRAAEEAQP